MKMNGDVRDGTIVVRCANCGEEKSITAVALDFEWDVGAPWKVVVRAVLGDWLLTDSTPFRIVCSKKCQRGVKQTRLREQIAALQWELAEGAG